MRLAASAEQYAEADQVYSTFLNNHDEFYGRKLKVFDYYSDTTDPATYRAAAKEVVAKFHPFAASWYAPASGPEPLLDQLSQLGVINIGAQSLGNKWFATQAPYSWTLWEYLWEGGQP